MERYNKPISYFKQFKLSLEEYTIYKRDMREYHLKNAPIRGIKIRRIIYPAVSFCVKLFRLGNKHTLEVVSDKRIKSTKPCIFAVTHFGKFDLERVFEACKTSCWIFNGDPETVHRNFDGFSLSMSGVILIDADSKSDRKVALETAVKLLKNNGNLMFFPEGIWNTEPSIPVLPLFPGIIEIAFRTGADIIPVALEQYGKHFQVNIGRNIQIEEINGISNSKKAILDFLRDEMATLKWEIFEKNTDKRSNIKDVVAIQHKNISDRLHEWTDKNGKPYYSESILKNRRYKPKNITEYSDVFAHLDFIHPTIQNAFLFNKKLK